MKRIVVLAILFFSVILTIEAQNLSYQWARGIGGSGLDRSNRIAVDALGNVYITGSFSATADFDPGPGTANLISIGSSDIFLAKYNASGNYIWAKSIGSTGVDAGYGISVDAGGNVYLTGQFAATADFDPGPSTANLTPFGSFDIFLAKYNSSGNYIWSKKIGGTSGDDVKNIWMDTGGNIFIIGTFQGTADFDPGPGTANLTSSGNNDIFFAKYDGNGNYLLAKSIGGSVADSGWKIVVHSTGNIYICGSFNGTADFDPGPGTFNLVSAGVEDLFFAKYDAGGNYIWAKSIGSAADDVAYSIATDAAENVYVTGNFQLTVDFDPGPGTANLTFVGIKDILFAKYDSGGNYIWAKNIGGTGNYCYGWNITLDAGANIYLTGWFWGTNDFDPGPGTASLTSSSGSHDILFAKYDSGGNYIWAKNIGSTNDDFGWDITSDAGGNVYITGQFALTPDFDPGPGTANLTSAGNGDIFFAKYSQCIIPSTPGTISGNTTVCIGSSTNYSVTNDPTATSYSWTLPVGWNGTSATNNINATTGATSGNITVIATNTCGSSPQRTLSVTVNPLPTINASTTNSILCVGQSATLTASGASTYTFNPGGTGSSIVVSPTVTSTYTINGTDANGCTNSSSFTQSVSTCASINQISISVSQIQVYPNPFNNKITVVSNSAKQNVLIYNALGCLIYKTEIENKKIEIDLSKESSGIYFIRIGTEIKKIIKE